MSLYNLKQTHWHLKLSNSNEIISRDAIICWYLAASTWYKWNLKTFFFSKQSKKNIRPNASVITCNSK